MKSDGLSADILEYQGLADSAVHAGKEQFHRILEALPTAAYVCDHRGLITYCNQQALDLWGRAPRFNDPEDRFCGSFKLYTTDGSPIRHDQCCMATVLRSQQGCNGQEILIERFNGERLAVLAYANPIRGASGELLGAVNVLVDISRRKQAEDAIRASRDTALASNRAKDQFLAVLSHELRTPLSPVVMSIAAMENNPRLPEEFREELAMIRRNIDLEMTLINDLLDVSRAISGKLRLHMQPVHVQEKLRHIITNCASELLGKKLTLHTALDAAHDRVTADPARLQQVFWNLLRNAIKFTPEGGEIFIRTWNSAGGHFCFEIRDTGVGITSDALPRIFEPFQQAEIRTTRQFGGLGLGLSVAKSVVEMHGGSIRAASNGKYQGAAFTVSLKTIPADAISQSVPPSVPNAKHASRRARLMIVEDHLDTASLMSRLLKSAGYHVSTAHSAASALQLADTEPFDVVLCDIGLPDATGYDLMARMKERHTIKGIALSGYGMEEDLQRSSAAGFEEHLVKPVNMTQLEAVIQRLCSEIS
jgi:signal transduction histidine kinase